LDTLVSSRGAIGTFGAAVRAGLASIFRLFEIWQDGRV